MSVNKTETKATSLKITTLSYDPMGDGFDTATLDDDLTGMDVAVAHAELFNYDGLPRLNLVLQVRPTGRKVSRRTAAQWRSSLRESERSLFDKLRQWRRVTAADQAVPEYIVAPNRTLAALAATRPNTLASLGEVPGVGEVTVAKHGEALLAVLGEGST